MSRSLTVQSVLYENDPHAIIRAAEATANAVRIAIDEKLIDKWALALGDSSQRAVLSDTVVASITAFVAESGGTFSYTVFHENLGHGGGHNRLAPLTSSDLILVLNPDAMLGPDAVSRLVATVDGDVGAADGRQLPLEHPKDYDPVTGDESWASGACLMTQRAVFEEVGGFDHETFFMYCDDVDYSWRVRLAGHRVVYQPAARVFHDKRLTVDADIVPSAAEVYYSAEAAVLLAYKYSRPDVAKSILKAFAQAEGEEYGRVIKEVDARRLQSRLPAPLDPKRNVSQFINGNYAAHRY